MTSQPTQHYETLRLQTVVGVLVPADQGKVAVSEYRIFIVDVTASLTLPGSPYQAGRVS